MNKETLNKYIEMIDEQNRFLKKVIETIEITRQAQMELVENAENFAETIKRLKN